MAEALRIPDDQLEFEEDLVFRYKDARFTGIAYELWPNGQTWSEISYVAGLQNGVAREWDASGHLLGESHYKAKEYGLRIDDLEGLAVKMQEWASEDGEVENGRLFRWFAKLLDSIAPDTLLTVADAHF